MRKIYITKTFKTAPNAKKDGHYWLIVHCVSEDGSVKAHFVRDDRIGDLGFDEALMVSSLSKAYLVPLLPVYDELGRLCKVELAS